MNNELFNQFKNTIVRQIVQNEIYGNEHKFQVRNFYPEQVIVWLASKQKAFKVTKLNRYVKNGEKIYEIEYDDVYTGCDAINTQYEYAKYRIERADRKGYNSNESVTTKFLNINDRYRQEFDCPNWSNEKDETGYKSCPYNSKGYERISREDSQSFEHFVQSLGYDNYEDFLRYTEFAIDEDIINSMYQDFLSGYYQINEQLV